jgi:hypothetical protein
MRKNPVAILNNEEGFVLVIAMMVMVGLTALAVVTAKISSTNLNQAANDKFHKMNFFKTDADTELVSEMIEQNIEQRGFGSGAPPLPYGNNGDIEVYTSSFYLNTEEAVCQDNIPTKANRDIQVANSGGERNDSYIRVYGNRAFNPGSGIEIAAGYHGRGKSAASGGVQIIYTIRNFGHGLGNSQTRIAAGWRHVM